MKTVTKKIWRAIVMKPWQCAIVALVALYIATAIAFLVMGVEVLVTIGFGMIMIPSFIALLGVTLLVIGS